VKARRVVPVDHVTARRFALRVLTFRLGRAMEVAFALVLGEAQSVTFAIVGEVAS
jgi:hypothetical protein